jgi:hypothetical protein
MITMCTPLPVQDKKYTQPQVFLAQRLLTAGVPPAVTDRLADLSAKLFGNQVHAPDHMHGHCCF